MRQIRTWIDEGVVKAPHHVVKGGVETFPEALSLLFSGGNQGKLVLEA